MTIPVPDLSASHRRRNPLTGDWVLVAAGRDRRPWNGKTELGPAPDIPGHDPDCHLCPGNQRATGDTNPDYPATFVFTNDFASLKPEPVDPPGAAGDALFGAEPETGTCRVLCFSPRHDLTLAQMSVPEIRSVVDLWCAQHEELSATWRWVQIFENRGEAMGASSPHPHGQLWAGSALPTSIAREDELQADHRASTGRALLDQYAMREVGECERVVVANDDWLVVVPYWATWPYETLLLARGGQGGFDDLTDAARQNLADILKRLLASYDRLFGIPFPYSMGWHPAPAGSAGHWVLHAHFYPPLLRAEARKFLVGYELLAETQRDLTPEDAAARLREVVAVG